MSHVFFSFCWGSVEVVSGLAMFRPVFSDGLAKRNTAKNTQLNSSWTAILSSFGEDSEAGG